MYELDSKVIKLKKVSINQKIVKCEIPIEYLSEEYVGIEDYFTYGIHPKQLQKDTKTAVPSNKMVLDSLVFDFNKDNIKDKILIHANPKENETIGDEYFNNINSYYRTLDILIGNRNEKYNQISSNKNIIPCLRCNEPMESYSDFKIIEDNSFSLDVINAAEKSIYQLIFEWKKDNFYLTKIGVKSFYEDNAKIIKLKNEIIINDVMTKHISDYINQ